MMAVGIPFNFMPGIFKVNVLLAQAIDVQLDSKRTLLISAFGTTVFAALLGFGLNTHNQALSGASVIAFVVAFSFGLAPVAWVVLSEVLPPEARTSVGSVGVSINWLTNFVSVSTFGCLRLMAGVNLSSFTSSFG